MEAESTVLNTSFGGRFGHRQAYMVQVQLRASQAKRRGSWTWEMAPGKPNPRPTGPKVLISQDLPSLFYWHWTRPGPVSNVVVFSRCLGSNVQKRRPGSGGRDLFGLSRK